MANDIDKLFHDQLHNRSFEWKEAYWESAEAAIVAAERKRRRRFLLFWWIGGVATVLGFGWWWGLGQAPETTIPESQAIKSTTGSLPAEAEDCLTLNETVVTSQEPILHKRTETVRETPSASAYILPVADKNSKAQVVFGQAETVREESPEISSAIPASSGVQTSVLQALPGLSFWAISEMNIAAAAIPVVAPAPSIQPATQKLRWQAGVGAGGQLDRLPGQALPGLWAGGVIQGQLLEKWGWTVGLQYAVQQLDPEEVGRTAQTTVGFGATSIQYVSEARSAHQLVMPVGVFRQMGRRVHLEAGALISYRLAVRGVVNELTYPKPWERTTQEQADYLPRLSSYYDDQAAGVDSEFPLSERSSVYARGWLESGSKGAFNIQPFAGVQYHVGERFSLTGRVAYPGAVSVGAFYWLR